MVYLTKEYFEYPTLEKTSFMQDELKFPAFTVCNKNPLSSQYDIPEHILNISRTLKMPLPELLRDNYNSDDAMLMGHMLGEFNLGCWTGRDKMPCNISQVQLYQSARFFNCYTFDVMPKGPTIADASIGIALHLYFDGHPQLTHRDHVNMDHIRKGDRTDITGAIIHIHEVNTQPSPVTHGQINIFPGFMTEVNFVQTKRKKLGYPYSKCTTEQFLDQSQKYQYSIHGCMDKCIARHIHNVCNCTSGYWADETQITNQTILPPCLHLSNINTSISADNYDAMVCDKLISAEIPNTKQCQCKEKCDYNKYQLTQASVPWPEKADAIRILFPEVLHPTFKST